MKKIIFTLMFFIIGLNAATIISQNIINSTSGVEINFNFDNDFNGEIFLVENGKNLEILLKNVNIKEKFISSIDSSVIKKIIIQNVDEGVRVDVFGNSNLDINASLAKNNKSLLIQFIDKNILDISIKTDEEKNITAKSSSKVIYFLIVIFVLLFLFLYFKFKRKFNNTNSLDLFDEFQVDNNIQDEVNKNAEDNNCKFHKNKNNIINTKEPKIVYKHRVSDDEILLLIEKNNQKYITFLSEANKIPEESFQEMIDSEEKFQEFLEIYKNK